MAKTLSVLSKGSTKAMIIWSALSELAEKRSTQIFSSDKITVAFAGTNLLPLNNDNQYGYMAKIDWIRFNVWIYFNTYSIYLFIEMEGKEGGKDLTYL